MIGKTISHYKITEELGRGGMGVVYKADDLTLKRTVALKFLSPHLLTDPAQKARFLHEAQAAAALEHPNISTIHEIHEEDGHTFMVMAYIEGEDLGSRITAGQLSVSEALDITIQVAKGISKAHAAGIVHRDIKPGNVLITSDGTVKVVDFGLAKLATQTKLTKTGTTMGTVAYMSPEQARGDDIDHRTDIWSLGVMLYEMLTGRIPFRGEIEPALLYSILNEDPKPVTEMRRDVPIGLENIIEKALAKEPAKRYSTMDALLADLETQWDHIALGIKQQQFTAWRRLKRRKRLSAGVAAAIVLVTAGVLIQTFHTKSMAIDEVAVLPFTNLSGDDEEEYFSDGMTEELIIELGQISALRRVISRTSVMRYKKTDRTIPEIAQELEVDAIVEASVRRDGSQVTIAAKLIRAHPEEQLWGKSFTRDVRKIMSIHSEVAQAIAEQIGVAVTSEEQQRLKSTHEVNEDAYYAYCKGRHHADIWTEESFNKAIQYFRQAIDIDPTYALAYVGLSEVYCARSFMAYAPPQESAAKARAAVEKALKLDDTIGEAHAILGWLKFTYDWDLVGAEADYQRAIELSPNSATVYEGYRVYLAIVGRYDEAIAAAKRSLELDPLTLSKEEAVIWSYSMADMPDEVIAHVTRVRETDPEFGIGYLAMAYMKKGMIEEAMAYLDTGLVVMEKNQIVLSGSIDLYVEAGRLEKAREMLDELLALSKHRWLDPVYVASAYRALEEWDSALDWLERGYEEESPSMVFTQGWDPPEEGGYRKRYQELMRNLGFQVD